MKRPLTKLPWFLSSLVCIALLIYGFIPEPVGVDLVSVQRGSLQVTVDDDGETRIREKYVVSAPVAGKLLRVQLHAGDWVEQGKTELARIEPNDPLLLDARTQAECEARLKASAAAVQQTEATLKRANEVFELANLDLDRAATLFGRKALAKAQYDSVEHQQHIAQADVRTAEFAVKVAKFELEHARIAASRFDQDTNQQVSTPFRLVSPISGRVLRVFLEDAGAVAAATPLLELGDPQDLEIEIDVLSSDAVRIEPGDPVYIEHWGGPATLQGVVRLVEPSAFLKVSALGVEEKRVNVIADFGDPWPCRQTLGDGFRIEARIVTASTSSNSLKIPAGSAFRENDVWNVYRVVDDRAVLCQVEIGETNGLETEIRSGLEEGDVLIHHPTNSVRNGVRVKRNE